jgi:hypothetical protein
MSDLYDSDGYFCFPRLDTLDGVPDEFVGGYVETDNGFRLAPEVEAEIEAGEQQLQALRAEQAAKLAEMDAKIEQRSGQFTNW